MVQEGKFRADLLFRLNVVRLHLPPLRERGDDVIILMEHFLSHFSMQFGKAGVGFSPRARKILTDYHYPGNVRELRNIVEYAVNICPDREIGVEHLPVYIAKPEIRVGVPDTSMEAEAAPAGVEAPEGEPVRWSEVEKKLIIDALVKAGGRRGRAAQILGWGRSTLWRKMKKYGIED
jgi:DNA-binding NtrC family response regulator